LQGIVDGVEQCEELMQSGNLQGVDYRPGVIDHDAQWLGPLLRRLGEVDLGL
jgi:hypothetical protein